MRKMYLLACSTLLALGAQSQIIWSEDFEGGAFPPTGWTSFDNGVGTTESWQSTTTSNSGNGAALINYEAVGDLTEDWLVTDQIDLTSTNSELRFFTRQEYLDDYGSSYEIRISTASQTNPADFVTVQTWNETTLNATFDTYEEKVVNLAAYDGQQVYIAFVFVQDDGDDWYIDDLTVGDGPACPAPGNVLFSNVDDNSADVSWTVGNTETSWNIEYGPAGFTPGSGTADVVTGTPAYAIAGLTSSTDYDFYVQADCGGSQSTWVGPMTFSTTCVVAAVTAYPWTEDFDGASIPDLPCGWAMEDVNSDGFTWMTSDYQPQSGANSLFISYNYDNTDEEMNDWAYTPELVLQAGTSYRVSFSGRVDLADYPENLALAIGASQSAATMTTSLLDLPNMVNEEYAQHYADFTVPVTGSYYIGFHGYSDANTSAIYVDDVSIDFSPSCPQPLAVTADDVTSDEADLSWTAGASETSWNVQYGPTGFTLGTGTPDNVTGTPAYVINGLTPLTSYDFYVQSDCGGGDESVWVGPFTFSTTCVAVAVTTYPWTENFDAVTTPDLPCGWAVENVNGDDEVWMSDSYMASSGENALYIQWNSDEAMDDWAYTPELVMTAGTNYYLTFKYTGSGTLFPENMEVFIGTDQENGSMVTQLVDLPNITNDTFQTQTISFTVPSNGSYYVGFHGYSDADEFFIAVDDIMISTDCMPESASISLGTDTLCVNDAAVTPVVTGASGGSFYGSTGLTVNASTGAVNPATSTVGNHSLYYVTSTSECADTSMVYVVISNCGLGLEESALAAIELFPNPTNGVLHAVIPASNGAVQISVVDFTGKTVIKASGHTEQAVQLDLSSLNSGVYFVQFQLDTAKEVRRVVLTK